MARRRNKRKSILKSTVLILSLIIILFASIYIVKITKTLRSDFVYDNIFINDELVSGMTKEELEDHLYTNYQNSVEEITFNVKVSDKTYTASLKDFDVKYDIESTTEKVFAVGREGSILEKLATISQTKKEPMVIHFEYSYNEDKIDEFVDMIAAESYVEKIQSSYVILKAESKVELSGGRRGESIHSELLKSKIKEVVDNANRNVTIDIPVVYEDYNKIDGEKIFNEIYISSKNASSDIIGKEIRIIPEKIGQEIDTDELKEAVDFVNNNENSSRTLEIITVNPEIDAETYEKNLFTSTLGNHATTFYTSTENGKARAINIKKATDIINGTIIAPGQTFSFNGVVGPRSVANGYAIAHVYESGEVVDGVGGGICQVSSTLYNAVLYADLEVTDRRNHMFIVPYVPLGADATVDYGSQDFKFLNNTEYPIKVESYVSSDNRVHFSIIGTDPDPSISIKIKSVTSEVIPFEVIYVDDPTLAKGTSVTKHEGMNGYVAEAFKVYYKNGQFVKEVSIGVSRYQKYDEVINVGTK